MTLGTPVGWRTVGCAPTTKTRRPCPEARGGPRAPDSQAADLPWPGILGRLIDVMRTTPRGVMGWRWCPAKLDRQPAFLAWTLLPPVQPSAPRAPHSRAFLGSRASHPPGGQRLAPAGRDRGGMVASRGPQQRA